MGHLAIRGRSDISGMMAALKPGHILENSSDPLWVHCFSRLLPRPIPLNTMIWHVRCWFDPVVAFAVSVAKNEIVSIDPISKLTQYPFPGIALGAVVSVLIGFDKSSFDCKGYFAGKLLFNFFAITAFLFGLDCL